MAIELEIFQKFATSTHRASRLTFTPALLTVFCSTLFASVAEPPDPSSTQSLNNYRRLVETTEIEEGAYSPALSEQLSSMASLLQEQQNHEQALALLKRASHISRINNGLYHPHNSRLLEQSITSHMALEQWPAVTQKYQTLLWLNKRQYGSEDPRLLPIIERLGKWHLEAYSLQLDGAILIEHLTNAHALFSLSERIVRHNFGSDDLRMAEVYKDISQASFYLATYQGEKDPLTIKSSFGEPRPQQLSREEILIQNSYYNGRSALEKQIELLKMHRDTKSQQLAEAYVQMGDWYQLFGRRQSAMDNYRMAYNELQMAGNEKLLKSLFGQPTQLPDARFFDQDDVIINKQDFVLLSFSVSSSGSPRDIEIVKSLPEDSTGMRHRARRMVSKMKFRPRFENGQAMDSEPMQLRLLFDPES